MYWLQDKIQVSGLKTKGWEGHGQKPPLVFSPDTWIQYVSIHITIILLECSRLFFSPNYFLFWRSAIFLSTLSNFSSVNGRFRVETTELRRVHVHLSLLVTSNQNTSNKKKNRYNIYPKPGMSHYIPCLIAE